MICFGSTAASFEWAYRNYVLLRSWPEKKAFASSFIHISTWKYVDTFAKIHHGHSRSNTLINRWSNWESRLRIST